MEAMTKQYETTPARRVAFLGLGVMGGPMAGHLAAAGHQVTVYNRTAAKAQAWVGRHGGRAAGTPRGGAAGGGHLVALRGRRPGPPPAVAGGGGPPPGQQP